MIRRKSPTTIIQQAPYAGYVERAWFKKPRKNIERASKRRNELPQEVITRNPRRGETMSIHQHPHNKEEFLSILPGPDDLKAFKRDLNNPSGNIRTDVIATREGKSVLGYVFIKPTRKILSLPYIKEYEKCLSQFLKSRGTDIFALNRAIYLLRAMDFKVRFVPNKKAGYTYKAGQFKPIKEVNKHKKSAKSVLLSESISPVWLLAHKAKALLFKYLKR